MAGEMGVRSLSTVLHLLEFCLSAVTGITLTPTEAVFGCCIPRMYLYVRIGAFF